MATRFKPIIQIEKFSKETRYNVGITSTVNNYTNFLPALRIDEVQDLLDMLSLL